MNRAWSSLSDLKKCQTQARLWFDRMMREEKKNKEKQNDIPRKVVKEE